MKKYFFAAFLVLASSAFAANSVSTIIQGVVPEMLTITTNMTPTTSVDVFNSSSTLLGYINVFSNRAGKWTITVTSTNSGSMKGITPGNADSYPYTLKFGTTSNISLTTPYVIEMSGKTTTEGSAYSLTVEFQNYWNLKTPVSPDTYRDTITVTIAAA
ncbi:MAG TPA: hypothetical protein VIO60_09035 [Rectinemataceae bacterium]